MMLTSDRVFQVRLSEAAEKNLPGELVLLSFTDPEIAYAEASSVRPALFVADEEFGISPGMLPEATACLLLTRDEEAGRDKGVPCVSRFRGADALLRSFLRAASADAAPDVGRKAGPGGRLVLFTTPCGGSGSTTLCEAYAIRIAKEGKEKRKESGNAQNADTVSRREAAILNLECCRSGCTLGYSGSAGLSPVILAVKSRRGNLSGMIGGAVFPSAEAGGVYVTGPPDLPEDIDELDPQEMKRLVSAFLSEFGTVAADIPFGFSGRNLELFDMADRIVMTSMPDAGSAGRISQALSAVARLDAIRNTRNLVKMRAVFRGDGFEAPKELPSGASGIAEWLGAGAGRLSVRLSATGGWFDAIG